MEISLLSEQDENLIKMVISEFGENVCIDMLTKKSHLGLEDNPSLVISKLDLVKFYYEKVKRGENGI